VPKRLASGNLTPPRKVVIGGLKNDDEDGDVDSNADLEKDLMEVKEAHDKLLAKVEGLEKLVITERTASKKTHKSVQMQMFILITLMVVMLGLVLKDRLPSTLSTA